MLIIKQVCSIFRDNSRCILTCNQLFKNASIVRGYSKDILQQRYIDQKLLWEGKKRPESVFPKTVFATNELDLESISVYGFDYDYTLAKYESSVEELIYELGKNDLITKYRYPEEIRELRYVDDFAIRGLHYDIERGLLMKLDQFQQIQFGSVFCGTTRLTDREVLDIYGHRALPMHYVEGHLHGPAKMVHLADLFSLPEMCLLSQVAQYFHDHELPYHSVSLFNDVKLATQGIHPEMHRIVSKDIEKYLIRDNDLTTFFRRLKDQNKELFIITNSPFHFVDVGMTHLLGDNWRSFFDVVVAGAQKPAFFVDRMRPFRELNESLHLKNWGPVTKIEKGKVYLEGNLTALQQMRKWHPQQVLYFGDHPYSDLADVSLNQGWRTGAIIWELDYEISCLNSDEYKSKSGWLAMLQTLIEISQDYEDDESQKVIKLWEDERDNIRKDLKVMFNHHFGSVFRTHDNPTYFSRRLFRFADVYTSRLTNLNGYSINHTFYPRKGVLPHEYKSHFV